MISLKITEDVKTSMKKIMENEVLRYLFSSVVVETNYIQIPKELVENEKIKDLMCVKLGLKLPPPLNTLNNSVIMSESYF